MLNQVPQGLRIGARGMVLRHPNAMDCRVYRRRVVRTAGAEAGDMGGAPTLGGLGVMDTEDEPQVDYDDLGAGKVLFGGQNYAGAEMSDRRDFAEAAEAEAMVEPITEGGFSCKDGDLVMVMPGAGVVVTYEVTSVLNTVNIPPFLEKYRLSPQGDLMFLPEVAAAMADRP